MSLIWFTIKFVFGLILAFALLHTCVTHFLLWYEWRLLDKKDHDAIHLSTIAFIKSAVIEFFCVVLKSLLYPFRAWPANPKEVSKQNEGLPILLVHGYMNHKADWLWFLNQLKQKPGIGPVYTINLTPAFSSISQLADLVQKEISFIREMTGSSQVILIGHSMGGLVSCYVGEYLAPTEIAQVITLGSPFQGTRLSVLGYGKNAREMSPHSPFLSELTNRMQQSTIPYYSIASKLDNMIIPWQSAMFVKSQTPQNTLVLEDHGHLRLLISTPVLEQITKWIITRNCSGGEA